jgi:hypothetical protein
LPYYHPDRNSLSNSNIKSTLFFAILILLLSAVILQLLRGNGNGDAGEGSFEITDPFLLEGKRLSQIYCSSCHVFPEPDLLPKSTWRFETLPVMARFLGVDERTGEGVTHYPRTNPYIPDNIYPDGPMVTPAEWQNILEFYWQTAPDELLPMNKEPAITVDPLFFKAQTPGFQSETGPAVTSVKLDPGNRLIYLSDANEGTFMAFDHNLELVHHTAIESPLSDIRYLDDRSKPGTRDFLATFIGHLYPSDAPYGSVARSWYDPVLHASFLDSIILDNIARPVQSQFADLNRDGQMELLVNEFGHRAGNLFWVKMAENDTQSDKRILIDTPGCIQSFIMDYTGNGLQDIVALCTQTDQAIYLFTNQGNGEFDRKTLLEFEITAGSSSFEIHDFNDNGHPDILYTSGDNADYSQVFKPYHGVYIFLNDGADNFSREWFYPVNGAYNAKARDFNGNGHPDIAVISFFADYNNSPEEGFLFFKNEGNLTFTPYHHPSADTGRWLTMDVADWTGNGRYDIILGNSSIGPFGPSMVDDDILANWKSGPYFLLLENLSNEVGQASQ